MGSVYLAADANTKERVCLKLIRPELVATPTAIERFVAEGKVARRLSHPDIARVFDIDQIGGVWFIAMEFAPGVTLREWLKRSSGEPFVALAEAVQVTRRVLQALSHLHEHNVIHRDIKPENILVSPREEGGLSLKLVDFGLACGLQADVERLTLTRMAVGTVGYMSPEQRTGGRLDVRTDLYSVAVVLYEMLSGALPDGLWEPISVVRPGTPPGLDALLKRALSKSLDRRPSSALEMLKALDEVVSYQGLEQVSGSGGAGHRSGRALGYLHWRIWMRFSGLPPHLRAIVIGGSFFALATMIPPWLYGETTSAGYGLIFWPPRSRNAYGHYSYAHLDWTRLMLEWVVIAVATLVAGILLRSKESRGDPPGVAGETR